MELTMEKIIVDGGYPLSGTIDISGMKNAAVAVVFASIAARGVPMPATSGLECWRERL
jgi:UDP-N-acetylglucosamine enolpyruvyl transferase